MDGNGAYLALKLIHLVGAAVLLGSGAAIAFFMFSAVQSRDAAFVYGVARLVVRADWLFTASAVAVQPVSGALLAHTAGYDLTDGWIIAALGLYLVAGACWLPVVRIQIAMRDLAELACATGAPLPARFHRLARLWFLLGWPAFAAVLAIFWLMIARPTW
ncbi:MAG: DUF2269 family protein [Alphaproteobacteria bacterium]